MTLAISNFFQYPIITKEHGQTIMTKCFPWFLKILENIKELRNKKRPCQNIPKEFGKKENQKLLNAFDVQKNFLLFNLNSLKYVVNVVKTNIMNGIKKIAYVKSVIKNLNVINIPRHFLALRYVLGNIPGKLEGGK